MAWKIEFEGEVYREADLTLDQVERIEDLAGVSWHLIAPLRSAKCAKAIASVVVADRKGIEVRAAMALVGKLKADDFIGMISMEDLQDQMDLPTEYEDGIPKAGGGTETPT